VNTRNPAGALEDGHGGARRVDGVRLVAPLSVKVSPQGLAQILEALDFGSSKIKCYAISMRVWGCDTIWRLRAVVHESCTACLEKGGAEV
jgi:hypothetical protein